ncbi:hypothetical protein BUALT_Bualt01G0160800 [Buddleja alternifolia]|uniref:MADS-box domain-containing protein n=1 Tax=Buddleja alternifolia TaxID=168488 RepID=A0AAV6Y8M8_9LAMI|nr:hypothetical protein BUALT_Bualt01G0160800 [Buddleja alternifolia]
MGEAMETKKKIENPNKMQLSFLKRSKGLFKKANDFSVLCDAEVAIILFSNTTGKVSQYASSSMDKILAKFKMCMKDPTKPPVLDDKPELNQQENKEGDVSKENMQRLKLRQMLGKDLMEMDLQEVHELQRNIDEGLLCLQEKKGKLLLQEITQLKLQVEELQGICPLTSHLPPLYIEYRPEPADKDSYEDSITSLQLRHLNSGPDSGFSNSIKNRTTKPLSHLDIYKERGIGGNKFDISSKSEMEAGGEGSFAAGRER